MKSRLRAIAKDLKLRLAYYRAVYRHPRTPRLAKALLWAALGYLMLPFDLIPDFLPVIGHLDDLVIVPSLIYLAVRLVPRDVLRECAEEYSRSRAKCAAE